MATKNYRVKLECYVVVKATSETDAKAQAETGLRHAIAEAKLNDDVSVSGMWAGDGWDGYGFKASGKPAVYTFKAAS